MGAGVDASLAEYNEALSLLIKANGIYTKGNIIR